MKSISSTDAAKDLEAILDESDLEPSQIIQPNGKIFYIMSERAYLEVKPPSQDAKIGQLLEGFPVAGASESAPKVGEPEARVSDARGLAIELRGLKLEMQHVRLAKEQAARAASAKSLLDFEIHLHEERDNEGLMGAFFP